MTVYGGSSLCNSGCGAVFKIDSRGKKTTLHSFVGTDGQRPQGGIIRDAVGNIYGTTFLGGNLSQCSGSPWGSCGVVYKLAPNGKLTVLHNFTSSGNDGFNSVDGRLLMDSEGNLYGTTQLGGSHNGVCASLFLSGCGTVFKIDAGGTYSVLYRFTGTGGDGALPFAGLVVDPTGDLYGTTFFGGSYVGVCGQQQEFAASGCGTVFKIDTQGKESVVYAFIQTTNVQSHCFCGLVNRDRCLLNDDARPALVAPGRSASTLWISF